MLHILKWHDYEFCATHNATTVEDAKDSTNILKDMIKERLKEHNLILVWSTAAIEFERKKNNNNIAKASIKS